MKNRLILLSLLAAAGVFCACSSQTAEKPGAAGTETSSSSDTSPSMTEPAQNVVTPGTDNSEIVTAQDIYGNRSETRTFRGHKTLDNVVVKNLADGTRIGYAIGKNGEKQFFKEHQIAVALKATGDELAEMAGFNIADVQQKIEPVTATQSYQPAMEPIPVAPSTTYFANPAPADDSKEQQAKQAAAAKQAEAEKTKRLQKELSRMSLATTGN